MSGRCSFPEDHRLFAGFLPAIRERIVGLLGGHDLILAVGAPAFTYHVEGIGPHVPDGAALCQLVDDPAVAAWTPVGTSVVGSIRLSLLAQVGLDDSVIRNNLLYANTTEGHHQLTHDELLTKRLASVIRQVTLKSRSMMFSSLVSIRLSCGMSPSEVPVPPMSIRCSEVTGTFCTRSMGEGRW